MEKTSKKSKLINGRMQKNAQKRKSCFVFNTRVGNRWNSIRNMKGFLYEKLVVTAAFLVMIFARGFGAFYTIAY